MGYQFLFLSLPKAFVDAHDQNIPSLVSTAALEPPTISSFTTPTFKVGTLDGLMQNAEELLKLADSCHIAAIKVAECSGIPTGVEGETPEQVQLRNRTFAEQYVGSFAWDASRYRSDRPLHELIEILQKELLAVDENVRARLAQYQAARVNLNVVEKLRHGNLTTKSLTSVVDSSLLIHESEFIETHLVVIPALSTKEFLKSYETSVPMVIPRSAFQVAQDADHTLYAVSTFKKHSDDFLEACKARKWIPRQFKVRTDARAKEQQDFDDIIQHERKARAEVVRLGKSEGSEVVKIWMHTLSLQIFIEAVLRYGFPLDHASFRIKTTPKSAIKIKAAFDSAYETYESRESGRSKQSRKEAKAALAKEEPDSHDSGPAYVYFEISLP